MLYILKPVFFYDNI